MLKEIKRMKRKKNKRIKVINNLIKDSLLSKQIYFKLKIQSNININFIKLIFYSKKNE